MEKQTQTAAEVKELAYRKSDRLEVSLWWVRNTLDTYVHVVNHSTEPPTSHYIGVQSNQSPNDVFKHPFAYLADQPTVELETIDGRGAE